MVTTPYDYIKNVTYEAIT